MALSCPFSPCFLSRGRSPSLLSPGREIYGFCKLYKGIAETYVIID